MEIREEAVQVKRRKIPPVIWMLLCAVCAAAVALGMFMFSGETKEEAPGLSLEEELYAQCLETGLPRQYDTLEAFPETLHGYPVRPRGVPEHLTYVQGSIYSDDLNTTVTHVYAGDAGMCIFSVMILNSVDASTSYLYEKEAEGDEDRYVAGCRLTCYTNSDDSTLSASWIRDHAQYSIFGGVTEEELIRIVDQTMNP